MAPQAKADDGPGDFSTGVSTVPGAARLVLFDLGFRWRPLAAHVRYSNHSEGENLIRIWDKGCQ
jgi:hypothetical protein